MLLLEVPVGDYTGSVPVIGWDYSTLAGVFPDPAANPFNRYLLNEELKQGELVFRNGFASPQDYALAWWYGLAPELPDSKPDRRF